MNQDKINQEILNAVEQLSLELTQVQDALEQQRVEMIEIEKGYSEQRNQSSKTYCETVGSAKYDTHKSNDMGAIETLASQITSPCMTCENAKLTVEIDDPTNLIFECLASVTTKKPVLACNKWTIAMDRDESHD
jgi:hypothetical protein